ncbi:CHAD domain-containing protein [Cupriavidus necator]|uniref:CYTH and CHAD domain-containing protein n=1 Tax=Cupriavidus necator TaxID=106590 RepID=UPI0039C099F4
MERELKFELSADQAGRVRDLPLLLSMQGGQRREAALKSQYFDTPELDLRRRNASLRVRNDGDHLVQTLKSVGERGAGMFQREEYESPVAGWQPDTMKLHELVPKGACVRGIFDADGLDQRLAPVFSADISRTVVPLKLPEGDEIELAIDRGVVSAGEASQPLLEFEMELKEGDPAHLYALAAQILQVVPLRLSFMSKGDRGYGLLVCEKPAAVRASPLELKRKDSVEAAFRNIAQNCLAQIHGNEAAVASGHSAEGVHQMRVGLRRLRSALNMFSPVLTCPDALQDEIQWIAGELGESRDWEVLAHSTLAQIAAEESTQADLDRVRQRAQDIATQRRQAAAEAISSTRYAKLAIELNRWVASAAWRNEQEPSKADALASPVTGFARDTLRKRHRKLVRRGRGLHKLDAQHRHRARIAAKKLRYATEFFASLVPQKALRGYHKALSRLQDDLGWGNDIAVADGLLSKLQHRHEAVAAGAAYARGYLAALREADRPRQKQLWKGFRRVERPR